MSASSSMTMTRLRPDRDMRPRRLRQLRQLDGEGCALSLHALDADGPAVRLDDLPRDVEAEAEPAVRPCGDRALEAIEDLVDLVGGDADAVVPDHERRLIDAVVDGDDDGSPRTVF